MRSEKGSRRIGPQQSLSHAAIVAGHYRQQVALVVDPCSWCPRVDGVEYSELG